MYILLLGCNAIFYRIILENFLYIEYEYIRKRKRKKKEKI